MSAGEGWLVSPQVCVPPSSRGEEGNPPTTQCTQCHEEVWGRSSPLSSRPPLPPTWRGLDMLPRDGSMPSGPQVGFLPSPHGAAAARGPSLGLPCCCF